MTTTPMVEIMGTKSILTIAAKPLTTNFVHHLALMLENQCNGDLKLCNKLHQTVHSCTF